MSYQNVKELTSLAERIMESALQKGASVAEAVASSGAHLSTKVRMGEKELVEEAGSRAVGLRVFLDQKVAVSYTSDLSERGIRNFVEDAVELAKLSQPDDFSGPPDPSLLSTSNEYAELDLYDGNVLRVDAEEALLRSKTAEDAARAFDERVSNSEGASFTRVVGGRALVTSGGFRGATSGTYASLSVRPVAEDSDGKKRSGSYWTARRHLQDLQTDHAVGVEAARRTVAKLGAQKLDTQEAPVIFDPDIGRSILGLLAGCISGGSIWRKSSYLAGQENERVASDLVSVVDNPLIPKAPGSRPFDGEGLASRINTVVDKGILKTYLMDSYSARKLNKESTASASRGGSGGVGTSVTNFILQPGDTKASEIIAGTSRGLYVTEMMGFGFNAVTGDFSRGASGFWIENGEFAFPVSEVTVSLNLADLLKRIDAVGDDLDLRTAIATPTFRVSAMTIAGR